MRRLLILGCFFLAACPDDNNPDAGFEDARPPDAATDTGPRDTGVRDAEPEDAEPEDAPAPDAPAPDADEPDSGPPDSGYCMDPVPRGSACAVLSTVFSDRLRACNPALTQAEADALGSWVCTVPGQRLDDEALRYSEEAAARCACSLMTASCTVAEPLLTSACAEVLTGTVALGDRCVSGRCEPGAYCNLEYPSALHPHEGVSCSGMCRRIAGPGESCLDTDGERLACVLGYQCEGEPEICVAQPVLGENCELRNCAGELVTYFEPLSCSYDGSAYECRATAHAGDSCQLTRCDPFSDCDGQTQVCVARPGEGAPCTLSIDVQTPNTFEREQLISEGRFACLFQGNAPGRAMHCVQTGTTTGVGTCMIQPTGGEPCGIGQGLSPRCAPGFYCSGIDPATLAPVTSTCVPVLREGEPCNTDWYEHPLGQQCQDQLQCGGPLGTCYVRDCLD